MAHSRRSEGGCTGAGQADAERAETALREYLARKHKPPSDASQPNELLVDEVMSVYLREHAPTSPSRNWIAYTAEGVIEWWSGRTLADVNGQMHAGTDLFEAAGYLGMSPETLWTE